MAPELVVTTVATELDMFTTLMAAVLITKSCAGVSACARTGSIPKRTNKEIAFIVIAP
jgi:hypothetical protein